MGTRLARGRSRHPRRRLVASLLLAAAAVMPALGSGTSASVPLSAVRNLTAYLSGDVATVSWAPPAHGVAGGYTIEALLDGAYYGTRITPAGTTSITWDRIPFNQTVQFEVAPTAPAGPGGEPGPAGPVNDTGATTAANAYCPAAPGACVIVDTASALGQESHVGAGLLHGTVPTDDPIARTLDLTHWRISAQGLSTDGATEFSQASAAVPSSKVIEILSDDWYVQTQQSLRAADPWSDWQRYDSFIASVVKGALNSGHDPIWEIQNEPENYPYSLAEPPTTSLVEQEYLHAYDAIKSVDPTARVIAPAIDWSYNQPAALLDMASFISFASAHGMHLYALSWHENCCQIDQNPLAYEETPEVVRDEAEVVRTLIAENPGLGHPQLYLDENSSASGNFIPGFAAGYFAEENRSGVNEAGRTCWPFPGSTSPFEDCFGPYLDQLLTSDHSPTASYWTAVDYAQMNGERVWSETSDANLSSLAVTDSSGVTRLLLGRHQTCSGWTVGRALCAAASPPPAEATTLAVLVPAGASKASVTIQQIPDSAADLLHAPPTQHVVENVAGGVVRIGIPAFADGQAYFVTVTPNPLAGVTPSNGNEQRGELPAPVGPPRLSRMLVEGGDYGCAEVGSMFQPLQILVTDQYGNPMAGLPITFSVPSGHAAFPSGSLTYATRTDSDGMATSAPIRAGLVLGSFTSLGYVNGRLGQTPGTAYFDLTSSLVGCS